MWKQNRQTSLECVSDPHEQINCVANDQRRDDQIGPVVGRVGYLEVTQFPPPPPSMLTPSTIISSVPFLLGRSLRGARIFCRPLFTAPFKSNPDASSGLLGWECLLSTPSLLPGVRNLHLSKLFSHSFHTTSFTRNLDAPSGLLLWECSLLLHSYGSSYPCRRLLRACLASFSVTALCMSFYLSGQSCCPWWATISTRRL